MVLINKNTTNNNIILIIILNFYLTEMCNYFTRWPIHMTENHSKNILKIKPMNLLLLVTI